MREREKGERKRVRNLPADMEKEMLVRAQIHVLPTGTHYTII